MFSFLSGDCTNSNTGARLINMVTKQNFDKLRMLSDELSDSFFLLSLGMGTNVLVKWASCGSSSCVEDSSWPSSEDSSVTVVEHRPDMLSSSGSRARV